MQAATFNKRTYTLPTFIAGIRDVFNNLDDLRAAARGDRIDRAFAEKIMLAVTQVNDCRYCNFGHTKAALEAGVTEEELQQLMAGDLDAFPKEESIALAFAQRYAESQGNPDPAAWQRLVDYYGDDAARDILAYIRMITFGNLLGNTFDALLSRLKGRPAAGSRAVEEVSVLLLALLVVPIGMILRTAYSVLRKGFPSKITQYVVVRNTE